MEDLLFEINETARAIRKAFDKRAAHAGVTRPQWRVLARVKREPGLRQVELAERLDMEPITLCRIVDRLAEAGLVERKPDPSDRRAWRVELTDTAAPLVRQLRGLAKGLAGEATSGMEAADLEALQQHLTRVRANLARWADQQGKAAQA